MLVIFKRLFRDRLPALVLFSIIGALFIFLYFLFYPLVVQQQDAIRGFMQSLPQVMLKAFGIEDLNIFSFEGFLAYKHYNTTLPLLYIFLLTGLAGSALSGEIERSTIETPLACPVSRLRMFFGIYAAGILTLAVFTIVAVLSVLPLGQLLGIEYVGRFHWQIAGLGLLFGWALFSLAVLVSAVCSQIRRTYVIMGGLLIVMYIIYLTAVTVSSLDWLKYFSLFGYFEPNYILRTNHFSYIALYVYSAVAITCTALGAYRFVKRDICL